MDKTTGQVTGRDLYQWDGSDAAPPVIPGEPAFPPVSDRPPAVRTPEPGTCRFRDEVYWQSQPRQMCVPGRGGDNVNMVVYGNVYIDQGGGGCRTRCDGRTEYYGSNYNYGWYCDPRWSRPQLYAVPYYEYGVRVYGGGTYDRSCWSQPGGWDYGFSGLYYSRDSVYGGAGGYYADRSRYRGGNYYGGRWDYGYYGGGGWGYNPGSYESDSVYGGPGGYYADRSRYRGGAGYYGGDAGQIFDFALRGADTYFGWDIARRHADGMYRDQGSYYWQPGFNGYNRGGYDYNMQKYQNWRQFRDQQRDFGMHRGY